MTEGHAPTANGAREELPSRQFGHLQTGHGRAGHGLAGLMDRVVVSLYARTRQSSLSTATFPLFLAQNDGKVAVLIIASDNGTPSRSISYAYGFGRGLAGFGRLPVLVGGEG